MKVQRGLRPRNEGAVTTDVEVKPLITSGSVFYGSISDLPVALFTLSPIYAVLPENTVDIIKLFLDTEADDVEVYTWLTARPVLRGKLHPVLTRIVHGIRPESYDRFKTFMRSSGFTHAGANAAIGAELWEFCLADQVGDGAYGMDIYVPTGTATARLSQSDPRIVDISFMHTESDKDSNSVANQLYEFTGVHIRS